MQARCVPRAQQPHRSQPSSSNAKTSATWPISHLAIRPIHLNASCSVVLQESALERAFQAEGTQKAKLEPVAACPVDWRPTAYLRDDAMICGARTATGFAASGTDERAHVFAPVRQHGADLPCTDIGLPSLTYVGRPRPSRSRLLAPDLPFVIGAGKGTSSHTRSQTESLSRVPMHFPCCSGEASAHQEGSATFGVQLARISAAAKRQRLWFRVAVHTSCRAAQLDPVVCPQEKSAARGDAQGAVLFMAGGRRWDTYER